MRKKEVWLTIIGKLLLLLISLNRPSHCPFFLSFSPVSSEERAMGSLSYDVCLAGRILTAVRWMRAISEHEIRLALVLTTSRLSKTSAADSLSLSSPIALSLN